MQFQLSTIRLFTVILLTSSLLWITGCEQDDNPVLAQIDGDVVLQNEFIDQYLLSTRYKPNELPTEENLKNIVMLKAINKMALREARALQIDQDSTYQDMVTKSENRILFYRYMRQEIIDQVVTDSLINKFYQEFTPQYQMRYIMRPVVTTSAPEFEQSQKDTIEHAYQLLQSGQKFEALAKQFSQDITTKDKGGDLGFVIRESLGDAELRAVMDTLTQFTYSKPFRGYEGYYILYKGERRDVPVPEFSEVRDQIWKTLYRTRRHLIKKRVEQRFSALAPQYDFIIHENVINEIKTAVGVNAQSNEFQSINFRALSVADMNKVLAESQNGTITVFDLFRNRKRAPQTMNDFYERLQQLSQQSVLAQHARELAYDKIPDLKKQINAMKTDVLRSAVYEKTVKEKVQAELDSLVQTGSDEKPNRAKIEQKLKSKFEDQLKAKYNFRFVPENFETALSAARQLKEAQNQEKTQ